MAEAFRPGARKVGTGTRQIATATFSPMSAALVALVTVFAVHAGVGLSFSSVPRHRLAILFDAGATAVLIAALVWLGLVAFRRSRRRRESDTAEINHDVRNALQLIVDAEYRAQDPVRRNLIMESVARIDRTLRKLFPSSGR